MSVADVDAVYRRGGCVYGSLAGELLEADDDILDDLVAGYDQWIEVFLAGLTAMRGRGDLRPDADPRHLAVSLVAGHQGGAMITHATGSPEPLHTALTAVVEYVRSTLIVVANALLLKQLTLPTPGAASAQRGLRRPNPRHGPTLTGYRNPLRAPQRSIRRTWGRRISLPCHI
jgi:sirohydrochlorin ferrochelatase